MMMTYIETYTGGIFDYADIESNHIDIRDIAWSLAYTNRYNGHSQEPWSVAQHSLLVSDLLGFDKLLMRYGLLHDASEAYIGDMAGPLKNYLPDFKAIEHRVETLIYKQFNMARRLSPAIKYADLQALGIEKQNFMKGNSHWACLDDVEVPDKKLTSLDPKIVYKLYLKAWKALL